MCERLYTEQSLGKPGRGHLVRVGVFHRPHWLWLGGERSCEQSQPAANSNAKSARVT